jgi:small multidrug resistance family-3 protein
MRKGFSRWLWTREGKNIGIGLVGPVVLVLYGVIPTLQPANFVRVYAEYGGPFIVLSILCGWQVDRIIPEKFDLFGGLIALLGVFVIIYSRVQGCSLTAAWRGGGLSRTRRSSPPI